MRLTIPIMGAHLRTESAGRRQRDNNKVGRSSDRHCLSINLEQRKETPLLILEDGRLVEPSRAVRGRRRRVQPAVRALRELARTWRPLR